MKKPLTIEMIHQSEFYKTRPKAVQDLIDKLPSTHKYEIIETGHICNIYSYNENGTVTVIRPVTEADAHLELEPHIEWIRVFGLYPEDLKLLEDKPIEVETERLTAGKIVIVKIQRSLAGTSDKPTMLIYTKDKKFLYEGPLTEAVSRLLNEEAKIYAECELLPNKDNEGNDLDTFSFSLIHKVKDQKW